MPLSGFEQGRFDYEGRQIPLYRMGSGPGVVIIHEVPGITPEVADFGRRVAAAGFTVVMPSLFGTPGAPYGPGNIGQQILNACVGKEFLVLARNRSSPITAAMRALCRELHAELGGPGVGAIGMCLTGNFALSLMVDESVMAPVLSQPSLPFAITPAHSRALHLSRTDLKRVKLRMRRGAKLLGLRFTHDVMCPAGRFETLRRELGPGFEAVEINSGPGNPDGIPITAHAVLTKDLVDHQGHPTVKALNKVLAFLDERLRPALQS